MPPTPRPTSDMNITPMIDVLLVLLVIFMAALPLAQRGLDVSLPPVRQTPDTPTAAIVAEIAADRSIAINRQPVALADLDARLRSIFEPRRDKTLFLLADATLPYGDIVRVIDAAKGAGVNRVGVVTEGARAATRQGGPLPPS